MAASTWTGTVSTDWNTATNWNPSGVPGSGNTVTIGAVTNEPSLGTGATVSSLAIIGGSLVLEHIGVALHATNGIALNSGMLVGEGELFGAITSTGTSVLGVSNIDNQNTPEFNVFSTITDNGNGLTLLIGDSQDLLSLYDTSSVQAVNFNNAAGTLELSDATGTAAGSLTVAGQMAVEAGTVFLGSFVAAQPVRLTDSNGVLLSTGTIFGAGTVNAAITATGAASIQANSGTLVLGGAIVDGGNALTLSLYSAGDKLLLDASGQSAAVHSANLDTVKGTLELNGVSLTVGSQMAVGSSSVQLDSNNSSLADAGGVTISTGTIAGIGTITAGITASGAAAVIANNGTLVLGGTVVDSGNALTLQSNGGSDLKIGGNASVHTVSFNGQSGTVDLTNTGTLTIGTNLAIGTGTVALDGTGATLTASTELVSTGTITGAGLVQGVLNATGAAHLVASGGKLEFANQVSDIGNLLTLMVAGNGDTLQLDFSGVAHSVSFNGASGTLALTNQGTLAVGTEMLVGTGTVDLESSLYELTDTGGIALGGGTVEGDGTIVGPLSGNGAVVATGGSLVLATAIASAEGPSFEIANGGGNALQLNAAVAAGNTFTFLGGAGQLIVGNAAGFAGAIDAFTQNDSVDVTGFVAVSKTFTSNGLVLTNAQNNHVTLAFQGSFSTGSFSIAGANGGTGTLVTLQPQSGPQSYAAADPLMTNTAGALVFDQVVGGQMVFTTIGGLGPEWEFDGAGASLLGDGKAGFLIRDTGSVNPGALFVGEAANGGVTFTPIGGLGQEWQFEGSADFLGTGQSEFLIRNTGAVESGVLDLGQVVSGAVQYTQIGALGLEWEFDGAGDFLGDGRNGFLIRNTGSTEPGALDVGEVVNGTAQFTPIGGLGPEWNFEGTGDFLSDGHTGFLIWNSGAADLGAMAIGEVINGQVSFTNIGGVGPEWQFVGTGTYLNGGQTDFLLRNKDNGALAIGAVAGITGSAGVTFTVAGGIGPEWTFHNTSAALLS